MAIIYNYPLNSILLAEDMLIGTSTKIVNGQPKNATKNFSIADLTGFIKQNVSLDDVLLVGNTSLLDAKIGKLYLYDTPVADYGNIALNQNRFSFSTVTHGEVFRAQRDMFSSFSSSGYRGSFEVSNITANRVWDFPDKSGTVALLSDVPVVTIPTLQEVTDEGNETTDNVIFRLNANEYIKVATATRNIEFWDLSIDAINPVSFVGTDGFYTKDAFVAVPGNVIMFQETGTPINFYPGAIQMYNTTGSIDISPNYFQFAGLGSPNGIRITPDVSVFAGGFTQLRLRNLGSVSDDIAYLSDIGSWGALNYPTWTTGTPFVKMTATGTFALDNNTYALDSNVVHKTGDENISGIKTFENIGFLKCVAVRNYNTNPSSSALESITATGGIGIKSENSATGIGIYSNGTGTGLNYVGANNGVTTFSVNKTGDVTGNKFVKTGGTSLQYLMADGSVSTGGGGISHATASGTDTYTATITGVVAYNDADAYLIRFTNGNTTSATLNINSLGAIPLYRNNDGVLIGGDIISGGEMLCVYNSTTNRFQVIGTAPNSLFAYVTNDDSVTLTKGMPVYAFEGTGDRMTVKRAFNTSDTTSAQTVGLVLSTSIGVNQKGLIMMQGLLDGLSILPTATWSDGDPVYLGATAGTITNVKPYAPNHLVYLGVVTTASNGAAGRMYVRVQNGYELQELHNVQAQSPSLKDTLWYDNTVSPAQWKTASIPTILGYTPVTNARTLTINGTSYDLTADRSWTITASGKSINTVSINTNAGSASSTDYVYLASGTINITLPTAVGNQNLYTIKNVGTGVITIDTTSSQTIDGSLTAPIRVQYLSLTIISDGANWNII